jgi:catechol 2,3-dioxygenase-like lactoylglutathione lyase family enzyme
MTFPSLRGIDHAGYTVPDLATAVEFFVAHFGARLIFEDGPFQGSGREMTDRLDVDPAAILKLAMLRIGDKNLELHEWTTSAQAGPAALSDIDGHHLAFYVDDIVAAYEYASQLADVRVLRGPNDVAEEAPVAGQLWFYLVTPWGMHVEITNCGTNDFYAGRVGEGMASPERRILE